MIIDDQPVPKTFKDYLVAHKGDTHELTPELTGLCPFIDDPDFHKLTRIQQKFVIGYGLRDLRGWSVANNYQFSSPTECTSMSAHIAGQKLMSHPKLRPFLDKWDKLIVERFAQSANRILEEEQNLAFSDIVDYLDEYGLIRPETLIQLPRSITSAIQSMEIVELPGGAIKYKLKLWDKSSALSRLERIKGMNAPEKVISVGADVTVPEGTDPREAAKIYSDLFKGEGS